MGTKAAMDLSTAENSAVGNSGVVGSSTFLRMGRRLLKASSNRALRMVTRMHAARIQVAEMEALIRIATIRDSPATRGTTPAIPEREMTPARTGITATKLVIPTRHMFMGTISGWDMTVVATIRIIAMRNGRATGASLALSAGAMNTA
jgi:hypothetical protein